MNQKRIGQRRLARECALQALYQFDVLHQAGALPADAAQAADDVLALYWAHFPPEEGAGDELVEFAASLVRGVVEHLAEVDQAIQRTSQHWRLERMARVDRNVLRLAVFELLHLPGIPPRVTLNEAIELGKKFGTEESGAFINGVLDRIARDLDKPEG